MRNCAARRRISNGASGCRNHGERSHSLGFPSCAAACARHRGRRGFLSAASPSIPPHRNGLGGVSHRPLGLPDCPDGARSQYRAASCCAGAIRSGSKIRVTWTRRYCSARWGRRSSHPSGRTGHEIESIRTGVRAKKPAAVYLTPAHQFPLQCEAKRHLAGLLTHDRFAIVRKDICGLLLGFAAFHEREIRAGVIGLSKALGDLPRKEIRQYGKGRRIAE